MINATVKKSSEQILKEMDAAAIIAEKDLKKVPASAVTTVATWMKSHYKKAGYKRLSRLLIAKVK
jgi:hypothetical protein